MPSIVVEPEKHRFGLSEKIREDILRDTRYPLCLIADRLVPYLEVLQQKFHPEQVVVFGSYAYGIPDLDSDVDLLVVKPIQQSRVKDKVAIRSAWWPLMHEGSPLSFDLMLAEPEECARLKDDSTSYFAEIMKRGLRVL